MANTTIVGEYFQIDPCILKIIDNYFNNYKIFKIYDTIFKLNVFNLNYLFIYVFIYCIALQ